MGIVISVSISLAHCSTLVGGLDGEGVIQCGTGDRITNNGGSLANMVGMPIELEIDNYPGARVRVVWFYERKNPGYIYKLNASPHLLSSSIYYIHYDMGHSNT